jgi:hypothetical protein
VVVSVWYSPLNLLALDLPGKIVTSTHYISSLFLVGLFSATQVMLKHMSTNWHNV